MTLLQMTAMYQAIANDGLRIPPPLQPYMQGRDFLPFVRDLPKGSTSQKRK